LRRPWCRAWWGWRWGAGIWWCNAFGADGLGAGDEHSRDARNDLVRGLISNNVGASIRAAGDGRVNNLARDDRNG